MGVSFFVLLCEFPVFGFVFHHLDFAYVGAADFRLKGSAAMVCDALSGVLPGAHRCFGCGFLVPHLSAKSGCFGEYLNVFVVFLFENMGINHVLRFLFAMDF